MVKKILLAMLVAASVQAHPQPVQAAHGADLSPTGRAALALADPPSSLRDKDKPVYIGAPGGLYLSTFPYSIVSADFDGDGKADIAVANLTSDTVTIFKGLGNGNFVMTAALKTDSGPVSVIAGNFIGGQPGGHTDIAVACWFGDVVDIFRGDGHGGFAKKVIKIPVGSSPACIRSADFNDDGLPDFAVSDFNDGNVAVIFNQGGGFFSAPVYLGAGREPSGLAVGDFDGDRKPDIAVACGRDNIIRMFLGDGKGTFREGGDTKTLLRPTYLASADFNMDGRLDLAVGYHDSNKISVFPGVGDGTFKKPVELISRLDPKFIVVGDFNGDGKPDMAATSVFGGKLSILFGNGDFTFTEGPTVLAGTSPRGFTAIALSKRKRKLQSVPSGAASPEAARAAAAFAVAASSDSSVNVFMGVREDGFYDLLFKDDYSTGKAQPPNEGEQRALIRFYLSLGLLPGEGGQGGRGIVYRLPVSQEQQSREVAKAFFDNRPLQAFPRVYDDSFNEAKRQLFPDFAY
ncbi:MAG: FG-GAP repeat domain-containing protein [Nitrospirota bacterium]